MRKLIEKELHVPVVAMMAVANVLSKHEHLWLRSPHCILFLPVDKGS